MTLERMGPIAFPEPAWETCECGQRCTYLLSISDGRKVCPDCQTKYARTTEGRQILLDVDRHATRIFDQVGLSKRSQTATIEAIPTWMRKVLPPREALSAAFRGAPFPGFGVTALAGAGKTMTMAALLMKAIRVRLAESAEVKGVAALEPWACWLSWSETVDRMRIMSMGDGGLEAAHEIVTRASSVELFVLDDLGAERIRGSASDDWAASQLDLIIDARDGAMLPTWYTTTLFERDLAARYGQRLFSRLVGRNPLSVVEGATDLRLE